MRLFFWYEQEADVNIVMKKKFKTLTVCKPLFSEC